MDAGSMHLHRNGGSTEYSEVSVIVPTFNRAHYIEECLDSLLEQTRPALEIIVVDDGSEDDTRLRLQRYGDRIKYVYKDNGGKPSAVNLGVQLAKGHLIWLFDDDDVALPHAIEHRIAVLQTTPQAGFVYTPHWLGTDGRDGRIVCQQQRSVPRYDQARFFSELSRGCFFSLSSALIRRDALREVGQMDVALRTSEDYDIALRLAHAFEAAFCPYPSFIVRQHAGHRGAKGNRYASHQRQRVFEQYDRMVGLKLRSAVPLGDYLVPRVASVNTPHQQREALLMRMVTMASKGCIDEMFDDLYAALDALQPGQRLNQHEAELVRTAICTGYCCSAVFADLVRFKARVTRTLQYESGRQAVQLLAKGLFQLAKSYPGTLLERSQKLILCGWLAKASVPIAA